jgi:hypothetical protein
LIAEYEEKWETFLKYITNNFGIFITRTEKGLSFYKKSRLSEDAEKARSNVSKQIRKALDDMKRKIPSLADHLDKSIKRGAKCCYQPIEKIEWNIRRQN